VIAVAKQKGVSIHEIVAEGAYGPEGFPSVFWFPTERANKISNKSLALS
jgi:hypothetical protein